MLHICDLEWYRLKTQNLRNFPPHGIFADGGAYVPTQEKKESYEIRKYQGSV